MSCFVYVLHSDDNGPARTYVGWTLDVARRLSQHNAGTGARYTRGRQWVLMHVEELETRADALRREIALKRDRRFRAGLRDIKARGR